MINIPDGLEGEFQFGKSRLLAMAQDKLEYSDAPTATIGMWQSRHDASVKNQLLRREDFIAAALHAGI